MINFAHKTVGKLKRAIVSVINDLVTDRRVDKTCNTLVEMGFEVLLVGRRLPESPPVGERAYKLKRMNLLFTRGPLFYAEYNIRLFFLLLSHKADLLFANDLDTLMPNFFVSNIKNIPIIYDSHEYFTETPELVNRKFVQGVWKRIERWIFPYLKDVITVNSSIANLYKNEYGKHVHVIRNIPPKPLNVELKTRSELNLPENMPVILLQGSGINIQRGAEELVMAMQHLEKIHLLIIGGGDVIGDLKKMQHDLGLKNKITFLPRMPFDQLFQYTASADLGLTLDKGANLNYRFSLPNKLFDYIHAGVPVLASPMVEIKKVIDQYQVGETIESHDPKAIAAKIEGMLADSSRMAFYRDNCKKAAKELNWETEQKTLIEILRKYA